jgi:hypothetical protein
LRRTKPIDRIENAIEDATIVVANVKTSSITLKAIVVDALTRDEAMSSSFFRERILYTMK